LWWVDEHFEFGGVYINESHVLGKRERKRDMQVRITITDSLPRQDQYTARPVCALVACDNGFMHFCLLLWEQHNGIDLHSAN
jgi:hypothetical protein